MRILKNAPVIGASILALLPALGMAHPGHMGSGGPLHGWGYLLPAVAAIGIAWLWHRRRGGG